MLLQEFSSVKKKSKLVEHALTEADVEFGPETGRELYPAGYESDGRFILHVVSDLLPRIKDDELTLKIMRDVEAIERGEASKENIKSVMAVFKSAKEQGLVKKYQDAKGKFDKDYKDDEEDMEESKVNEANPAKMSDKVLKSRIDQMQDALKSDSKSPALNYELKRLNKELKKRNKVEEDDFEEGNAYAHAVRKAKMDGAEKGDEIDGPGGKKIKLEDHDMSHEAHELVLYAENDSELYTQSAVPIMKNLTRKFKKGAYDPALAVKLWKYHADRAAKKYGKDHGNDDGFKIFSPADRREAAKYFEEYWTDELNAGNTMESKVTENKDQALRELRDIMSELEGLGDAAASIMQEHFPSQYSQGEAYGAFSFGSSSNKYNTTLESLINDIEQGGDDYEDEE
jgi:hypothetical protein